ncbi:MAG: sigma-70 family RNA polymerase sigma factor [Henriciella sp.]|nr:sigma-70 family RNA polymerase sigma factor [Henriciella sp.]
MFAAELEKIIPDLRAYARMLCGDPARADDIVQNACLKAWDARTSFAPEKGSFKGWMMTITRNEFLQDVRKQKRIDCYAPSDLEDWLVEECQLSNQAECSEAIGQLFQLSREQRDVFILVVAMGYSYEEAANICACSIGTIKSRINRARANLAIIRDRATDSDDIPASPAIHSINDLCGYAEQLVHSAA